jgi:hypothetical protein
MICSQCLTLKIELAAAHRLNFDPRRAEAGALPCHPWRASIGGGRAGIRRIAMW